MFKRIKQLFKDKPKEFIVLRTASFSREAAIEIAKTTGKAVILAPDVNDVKLLSEEKIEGDGKEIIAEFFGPGTEEEYKDLKNEETGMKAWLERLKRL